jgi:integrase
VPDDLKAHFHGKSVIKTRLGNDKAQALVKHAQLEQSYKKKVETLRNRSNPSLSALRLLEAYEIPQRKLTEDELFHLDDKFEALGNDLTYDEFDPVYKKAVGIISGRQTHTLSTAFEIYEIASKKRNRSTYNADKSIKAAIEILGDVELAQLRRANVHSFYDALVARNLKKTTITTYITSVAKVIRTAIIEGDLVNIANPFASYKIEIDDRLDRTGLTKPLWQSVINSPTGLAIERETLLRTIATTGVRLAEACALRVSDLVIDDKNKVKSIMVVWHEGRRLKNKNSTREVPICVDSVGSALFDLAKNKSKNDYLFPDYALKPNAASVYLNRWLKKTYATKGDTKIIVIHGFRHLMNDAFKNSGVEPKLAESVLGWSSEGAKMTSWYGSGHEIEVKMVAMSKAINWLQAT